MTDKLTQLQQYNRQINDLITNKQFNNKVLKNNINRVKIEIYGNINITTQNDAYLSEVLKFIELNLIYTLHNGNTHDLQLAIQNVKFFYENSFIKTKPTNYSMITAIHLLFLLSTHRNQQFYSKLQTLSIDDLKDQYIAYVFLLNQAIEEGNYRRVFKLKKQNPLEYFKIFLQRISETVRTEIAKSAEKAYVMLNISEALQIFQLESMDQMKQFIDRYINSIQQPTIHWKINGNQIYFEKDDKKKIKFNSDQLIKTTLSYAHQLEKIA